MTDLFVTILNMSLVSSYVALAVIFFRFLLKKSSKIFSYGLWAVVLFRLVCPFSLKSNYSLIPPIFDTTQQNVINPQIITSNNADGLGETLIINIQNSVSIVNSSSPINFMEIGIDIEVVIWLLGIVGFLCYGIVTYVKFKKIISTATLVKDNIYETDRIHTPFVLGFIKPRIYILTGIPPHDFNYIILHEKTHIRRFDYLIKPFAYFILTLHWFNPIMWVCYYLMTKDMEMSCDESVIKQTALDNRSDYSKLLLSLSINRNGFISPLAFGESNVKKRIKNVIHYKKSSFLTNVFLLAVLILITVGLGCTPKVNAVGTIQNMNMQNLNKNDYEEANIVISNYFQYQNDKDEIKAESTLTDAWKSFNIKWEFENLDYINIINSTIEENETERNCYVKDGRGAVNGVKSDDLVILRVKYSLKYIDDNISSRPSGMYDYYFYLIRDSEASPWKIDDQGPVVS